MRVKCIDNWFYEHLLGRNKIYEVIRETNDNYVIMIDRVGYVSVSKDKFIICKEDKMEEIRVVRKLEDLHNLENGMGLYIDYNLDVRVKNKNMLICYGNDLTGDRKDNYLEVLKAMGFKFEYKPLRSLEEVIEEMETKRKLHKFNDFNYFVNYVEQDKKYYVSYDCFNNILGAMYFDKETANSYCEELNEIIKTK